MRSMLFMVLALWVLCESRGYGKQGMGDLLLDAAERRGMLFAEASDAIIPDKPWQLVHIAPMLPPHDGGFVAKGPTPMNITDGAATNKHSLRLLVDRDVVGMERKDSDKMVQYGVGRTLLHDSNVHVDAHMSSHSSHAVWMLSDTVRLDLEGDNSERDIITDTDNDKEANAVRRQGVDSNLFTYAGLALPGDSQQTGLIYGVNLPPTLAGIQAQATRLTAATLKIAGLGFNEFTLPPNASFDPTSVYVTMVYVKISNFTVYTLPPQYEFGGPVVGIIGSPSNTTSVDPSTPQVSISLMPNTFINISLPMYSTNPTPNMLCAFLASNGSIFVSKMTSSPNICLASTLGYFALIVQASSTPSSTPNSPPPVVTASPTTNANTPPLSSATSKSAKNWKLIVGATCLSLGGLAFLVAVALISIRLADSCKLFFTSRFTGNEEALQNSLIGSSKAPSAPVMRTKPALEIDMAHFTNSLVA